jgi:hypothetical protein
MRQSLDLLRLPAIGLPVNLPSPLARPGDLQSLLPT